MFGEKNRSRANSGVLTWGSDSPLTLSFAKCHGVPAQPAQPDRSRPCGGAEHINTAAGGVAGLEVLLHDQTAHGCPITTGGTGRPPATLLRSSR